MSLRFIIDMNLSPEWVDEFARYGWPALHWSSVGDPAADDATIMAWARSNDQIVFTHDLDYGTMLALTHATGPSVFQIRGQYVLPEVIGSTVAAAVRMYQAELTAGALVVVDVKKQRVRILPL
jgi:predicted nuclease of predicted toxin-antitoxin system